MPTHVGRFSPTVHGGNSVGMNADLRSRASARLRCFGRLAVGVLKWAPATPPQASRIPDAIDSVPAHRDADLPPWQDAPWFSRVMTKCRRTRASAQLYEARRARTSTPTTYDLAIKNLQFLEARYPFGPYAEQAQLELIYAHFRNYDHEEAVAAADRFVRLHPQHPNVDYAYYMKGLSSFTERPGLARALPAHGHDASATPDRHGSPSPTSRNCCRASRIPSTRRMRACAWCICAICWPATKSTSRTTISNVKRLRRRTQPWALRGGELPGDAGGPGRARRDGAGVYACWRCRKLAENGDCRTAHAITRSIPRWTKSGNFIVAVLYPDRGRAFLVEPAEFRADRSRHARRVFDNRDLFEVGIHADT
jgi:hypothetical protein